MYAVEFNATVKDGIIKVPPQYMSQLRTPCRVLILQDTLPSDFQCKEDLVLVPEAQQRFEPIDIEERLGLKIIQINTTQWKFRREEIYAHS